MTRARDEEGIVLLLVLVLIVLVGRDRFGSWTGGVRALAAGMLRRFTGGSAAVPVPPGKGR